MKINTEEFAVQKVQKVQTKFADQTPNWRYLQRNLMLIEKVIVLKHSMTKKKKALLVGFLDLFYPMLGHKRAK